MTREQKEDVIRKYCSKHDCSDCAINKLPKHEFGCCCDDDCTDEEINMNYKAACKEILGIEDDDIIIISKDEFIKKAAHVTASDMINPLVKDDPLLILQFGMFTSVLAKELTEED